MHSVLPIILVLGAVHLSFENKSQLQTSQAVLTKISSKCKQQMSEYLENLASGPRSWAIQMIDATGKVPSGLLKGNIDPGNFDECLEIKVTNDTNGDIFGKYCLGSFAVPSNDPDANDLIFRIARGFCVPDGCTAEDVSTLVNKGKVKNYFKDECCQTIGDVEKELSGAAIGTICFLTVLLLLFLVLTLYDMYCTLYAKQSCHAIVRGFSFYTNCQKIFKISKSKSGQFECLNGIRCLSTVWVVYDHLNMSLEMFSRDILDINNAYNVSAFSMFVRGATFAVDSFFLLSATLVTYHFLTGRHKQVPFNIIRFYVHRYLRLVLPLALIVLITRTLLTYMGSGPRWPLFNSVMVQHCVDHWWSCLLFIQNFVNWDRRCLGHTWYLNVEMQLFVASPPLFYLIWKHPTFGLSLASVLIVASMSWGFYLGWTNVIYALNSNFYGFSLGNQDIKYLGSVLARSFAWFIGIILGYCLFRAKTNQAKLRISKLLVAALWVVSLVVVVVCIMAGYDNLLGPYEKLGNVLHLTFVRSSWCLAVSWIIFACSMGYGGAINWFLSLPIFQVMGRFTYSVYLVHVVVIAIVDYNTRIPVELNIFMASYSFWGTLAFSVMASFPIMLVTELPLPTIERIIFGCWVKKLQKKPRATQNTEVEAATSKH